jgi:nucleolar complex protein 2
MSVDDFMSTGLNDSSSETASIGGASDDSPVKPKVGKLAKQEKIAKDKQVVKKSKEKVSKVSQHKMSLEKLKESDPEFYIFLESQDKELLDFNDSESDDDDDIDEDEEEVDDRAEGEDDSDDENDELVKKLEAESDDDDDSDDELYHQPPAELEVASESDEEQPAEMATKRTGTGKKVLVNMKMLKEWGKSLKKMHSLSALHKVIQAFKAAVLQTKSEESKMCQYVVEDRKVFNGVIRLCLSSVLPTVEKHLALAPSKDSKKPTLPDTSPRWKRLKPDILAYLKNLIRVGFLFIHFTKYFKLYMETRNIGIC